MDLSVILPVYNEAKVIASTLKEIDSYLKNLNFSYEIIIVNDGSTDDTLSILKSLKQFNFVFLQHEKNLGKGAAIKTGVLAAKGEMILFTDADNSTSIDNLPRFIKELKENRASIVIGSRALDDSIIKTHQPRIKEIFGKTGNWLIRFILVKGIKDTQCGFKLYDRSCLKLFRMQTLKRWGFDFEILFLARKYGFAIEELPVVWTNNLDTRVKSKDYLTTFKELFLVRYNNLIGKYKYDNKS